MRKGQKILLGVFLTGILLGGVGTGVAIGEYSSMAYLGERIIGEDMTVTEQFDFSFDPEQGDVRLIRLWYGYYGQKRPELVEDVSVPENVIRYELSYNPDTVEPELVFREYEDEPFGEGPEMLEESEKLEVLEESEKPEESEALEESDQPDGADEPEDAAELQARRIQGELFLETWYHSDMHIWMEQKDAILNDLKNRQLASYRVEYITDVTVRVNPATAEHVVWER